MAPIAIRVSADFHLDPMNAEEVADYVHAKLRTAGNTLPETVFPASICNTLWAASGGWPGVLDRICLLALAKTEALPVAETAITHSALPSGTWTDESGADTGEPADEPADPPTLIVTQGGEIRQRIKFEDERLLVGRSAHNDLTIVSRFVSRHHMLMVRHGSATFLMDLNSTNGTFVNSRRVSNHVLSDADVISIGNHRIKFCDPSAVDRQSVDASEIADTVLMKSLEDVRSLLGRDTTELLPIPPENLPTTGN